MFGARKLSFDKNIDKNIVLCQAYNRMVASQVTRRLANSSLSYRIDWVGIPFFLRNKCRGASQVCVFSVNRCDYTKAKMIINELEDRYLRRLSVNHAIA
ncbi:MAG: hypothetical protein K5851_01670 [Lachnospiraceae bacterium]|nr:hypothetical protein [Lachnospiraceae bacterium]